MTCDFEVHKRNMSCARCEETLPTDMWGATLNLRHYFPVTMSNTATVVSTRVLLRMSTMATHAVSMNKAAKVEAEARVPIPEVELEALRAVIVVTLAGDDDDDNRLVRPSRQRMFGKLQPGRRLDPATVGLAVRTLEQIRLFVHQDIQCHPVAGCHACPQYVAAERNLARSMFAGCQRPTSHTWALHVRDRHQSTHA